MPLWIILTKWPALPRPQWVMHGPLSAIAAVRVKRRASEWYVLFRTSRHQAGAVQRAGCAAAHAHADEREAGRCGCFAAAIRIVKRRVATVDHNVTRSQERRQSCEDVVHGGACFHHHQDAPGPAQRRDQIFEVTDASDAPATRVRSLVFRGKEGCRAGVGTIVGHDGETVTGEVPGEIPAHDGEPDDANVVGFCHRSARWQSRGGRSVEPPHQLAVGRRDALHWIARGVGSWSVPQQFGDEISFPLASHQ